MELVVPTYLLDPYVYPPYPREIAPSLQDIPHYRSLRPMPVTEKISFLRLHGNGSTTKISDVVHVTLRTALVSLRNQFYFCRDVHINVREAQIIRATVDYSIDDGGMWMPYDDEPRIRAFVDSEVLTIWRLEPIDVELLTQVSTLVTFDSGSTLKQSVVPLAREGNSQIVAFWSTNDIAAESYVTTEALRILVISPPTANQHANALQARMFSQLLLGLDAEVPVPLFQELEKDRLIDAYENVIFDAGLDGYQVGNLMFLSRSSAHAKLSSPIDSVESEEEEDWLPDNQEQLFYLDIDPFPLT